MVAATATTTKTFHEDHKVIFSTLMFRITNSQRLIILDDTSVRQLYFSAIFPLFPPIYLRVCLPNNERVAMTRAGVVISGTEL